MGAAPAFFGTAADGGAGTPNSGDVAGRFLQRDSEACYASDAGSGRAVAAAGNFPRAGQSNVPGSNSWTACET